MKKQVHSLWKMTRRTMLACLLLLGMWQTASAQTALGAGDIVCTGFNSNIDASSQKFFQYVLLKDIAAGTTFKMSGNTFQTSGAVGGGSATCQVRGGVVKWVASGAMSKGSVINITTVTTGSVSADVGTASVLSGCGCTTGGTYNNNTSGGKVLIYYSPSGDGTGTGQDFTGTSGTVTFKGTLVSLTAWQGTTSITTFPTSGTDINVPYRPSDVSDTTFIASSARGGTYTGTRTFSSVTAARSAIYNRSNWTPNSSTSSTGAFTGTAFTFGSTPSFTGATTKTVCQSSTANSINANLTITDAAASGTVTETWTVTSAPTHGTLGGFSATASSTGGTVTPSGLTYTPTSGYTGTDAFTIQVSNGTATASQTVNVTVAANPNPGTISAVTLDSLCATAAVQYATTGSGGVWSSSAPTTIATVDPSSGVITSIYSTTTIPSGASATISYTASTVSCGTTSSTKPVYIRPFSDTGSTITPASGTVMCTGATLTATSNSVTAGLPRYGGVSYGRTWTTQNSSIASVNNSTGVITAVSAGTVNITYTTSPNGCGSFNARKSITVTASASGGTISGTTTMCVAASNTLTSSGTTGGVWSSSNTSIATVNASSGAVTGVSGGSANITYTATNSCGSAFSSAAVTINPLPNAGTISGATSVCNAASTTLSSSGTGGGTWSSSASGVATVSSAGVVTGASAGSATITYSVTNSCGTQNATSPMTVNPLPNAGTISGATSVCNAASTTLSSSGTGGGTWSSSASGVATVSSAGAVTGVSAGSATISYSVTNGCGTNVATSSMTVNPLPNAGTISGASTLCTASTTTLTSSGSGGGTWSSSNTARATVDASGVVTGVAAGAVTISYSVTNGCGTNVATQAMTVNTAASAGTISGATSVCVAANTTLSTTGTGGTWSSSATGIATISSGGVVTGVSAGSATISYTVSGACGSGTATASMTVNPLPNAGTISGASSVCVAATTTLAGAGGGTWSTANAAVASVSTGTVYGVSAGSTTISYTVTNSCGTASATKAMTVNPLPSAGTISGASSVCEAASTTLSTSGSGGTWSSAATGTATVSTGGVVTGVAAGSTTISYTASNSCGTDVATQSMTVNPLPNAGSTSGATTVCVAATTTLTAGATGGTWSSSNTARATVNTSGDVTGVGAGAVTISYSVTNGCGTDVATYAMTVNPLPNAGTISGATSVCNAANTTLSTTGTGGTWSSSATGVASVNTSGVVHGVSAGSATITYTVTNSCGTDAATASMTVNPLPNAGTVSGITTLCTTTTTTLTSSGSTGGTWSSSNTARATVDASGVVTGVSAGAVTISYAVTNGCGTDVATQAMTITNSPSAGTISGATSVCAGSSTTLSTTGTGGSWSSSATGTASVNASTGSVYGVSAGSATITYTVTTSCGTDVATSPITVNPLPDAGSVSGASTVCAAATTTLTSSGSAGGTWSSSNTARATVDASGVVTGVAAGAVTISYTVTNGCGTDVATASITVNPLPNAGTISGATSVCATANTTLTASGTGGGSWTSSATGTATVSSAGAVHGVSAGSATITYTVTNSCGSDAATASMTVNPLPNAGTVSGSSSVCVAATTTLTASGSAGGTWTSSNATLASVDASTGDVTGIATGSVTITYSVTNGCGTNRATASLSVTDVPTVAAISGPSSVCQYASITLTDATSGGTWSSVTPSVATVSPTGVVTGLIVTGTTIRYELTNGCGTTTVSKVITVNPLPATPASITGSTTIGFTGGTTTLSSATTGGSWTSSNAAILTVNTSGVVTAVASGTATITYTVSNSCGSAYVTASVTCASTNHAPMFMGGDVVTANVCANVTAVPLNEQLKFKDLDAGQTVTISVISGTAHGTITAAYTTTSTGGIIVPTGLIFSPSITDLGMDSAYVRVSDGIASDTVKVRFNVIANPITPTISGTTTLCLGTTSTLTAIPSGGYFGSMDGNSVTGSTTGVVTALGGSSSVIYYNGPYSTAGCRTQARITIAIINVPTAAILTGSPTICPGSSTTLAASIGGGSWSSSNTSIATVTSGGSVTGVASGVATISYVLSNMCGNTRSTRSISISSPTVLGPISGSPYSCIGTPSTLTNATSGGSWSSTNTSVANVSSAGIVTPVAVGMDTIIYAYTNSCGTTASVTRSYRVYPTGIPATITGPSTVVNGSAISLSSSPAGGTWASSNATIATVAPSGTGGSTSGMVTGRSVGTAIISYTISTTCAMLTTTYTVSVTSSRMNNTAGAVTEGDVTVSLFPNPTSGTVAVELSNAEGQTDAIVTDIAGKVIVTQTSATPKLNLDLSKLAAGTYFVKVKNAGNTFNEKIIVE